MVDLAAPLLQSLLLGSLYAMMALGLTMAYRVTKVPNFAHAEFVTVGGYMGVAILQAFGSGLVSYSQDPFVATLQVAGAVAAAFAVAAVVALGTDELVFKPLTARGATPLHLLVASIGAGLILRYILFIIVGTYDLLIVTAPMPKEIVARVGTGVLTNLHLWVIPTVLISVVSLHLLFTRTKIGKGMRAMASNLDLAKVSGIPTAKARRLTWLIAGGLAGTAGALYAIDVPFSPETGWGILLWMFSAAILGGFVSFWGTILGGYSVGFAENLGITLLHNVFAVPLSYRPLIALIIIVVVFLWRPTGLLGGTSGDGRGSIRRLLTRLRRPFSTG
ncbi:MAG: branched-chain amino acid ABC transporter permease [Thermoplasmata archaeon]